MSTHKPYRVDWNIGDLYAFEMNDDSNESSYYVLMLIVNIILEDWNVKGIEDEVSQVRFYISDNMPDVKEDLYESTPLCFRKGGVDAIGLLHPNIYTVNLYERSKRKRPKDLVFIGSFDEQLIKDKIPEIPSNERYPFFWGELNKRDFLTAYSRQKKLEESFNK